MTVEIRRIAEPEAGAVVELWDAMCRAVPDGGPLTAQGRRHLLRMLECAAWHRDTFCLVAASGAGVLGFAMGHVEAGDGLLPGAVGEAGELYVRPSAPSAAGLRRRLAEAVVERLLALGADPLRSRVAADDPGAQAFWAGLGFEPDMVVLSRYPRLEQP